MSVPDLWILQIYFLQSYGTFFSLFQSFKQSLSNFEQDSPLIDLSHLEHYQKDTVHMDLMFLLELKHDSGRFLTLYTRFVGD